MILWYLLISNASASCESDAFRAGHATLRLHQLWAEGVCSSAAFAARQLGGPRAWRGEDPPAEGELAVRDAFRDSYDDTVQTEHFVIKWGQLRNYERADLEALAVSLEESWSLQVDDLGLPGPPDTHAYKLNVYIGGSAADLPQDLGASGYFWYDEEGYAMLVISEDRVGDRDEAASVAAHELFHGVQASADVWGFDTDDAWFLEASATFVQHRQFPGGVFHASNFPGFAFLPQLPLNWFDYPGSGATEEYHHYGAFVWVEHLWEEHGGDDLLSAHFDPAGRGLRPLARTEQLLGSEQLLHEAIAALHQRTATLDFTDRDALLASIDDWGGWSSSRSQRPTGATFGETRGFIPSSGPGDGGMSIWELRLPPSSARLALRLTDGPSWFASVVSRTGESHTVRAFELTGNIGELTVDGLDQVDEAWLVVTAIDTLDRGEESWPFELSLEALSDDVVEPPVVATCGCQSGRGAPLTWLILLAATALRRGRSS